MTHPAWCTQQHADGAEHRSYPLTVLLPHEEQITAVLAADVEQPAEPTAELVHSARRWPATHPDDTNAVAWIALPATHLAQLAGALSELATIAAGGTPR